jgi:predicted O-linked N-acetylglucosamine transferase (SPINDLY family)
MSPVIDYQLLPDDFVASEERFSETVIRLPPEAIPYAAPAPEEPPLPARGPLALPEGPLRVAIPASLMKINAPFLEALAQISARASRPVEFVFYPLAAVGLAYYQLRDEIKRVLPGAVVNAESSRSVYLERLGACAFFLCPFPYGNMNSIIDAVIMGVPGVCLDGEEAHSHADVAIFRRLGLPDELTTDTVEAYVAAAVRLIDDAEWLDQCRRTAREIDLNTRFYGGGERLFCEAMYGLLAKAAEPVS